MKRSYYLCHFLILLAFSAGGLCMNMVSAQESSPALNELLEEVQRMVDKDRRNNRVREQEFMQHRERQHELLQEAKDKLQAQQEQSTAWEKQFDDNEVEITKLEQIYQQRAGDFTELSGLMGQFATALRTQLSDSMINMHLPDWQQRMDVLQKKHGLPDTADIEGLWKLFLEAIVLQGQTLRFQSPVLQPDGSTVSREVVSIGPFTAISDGGFLAYLPEVGQFTQLPRQPDARYLAAASEYVKADTGFVAAPLDPSRGVLLSLLIGVPTLEERLRQGGWIGYLILLIGSIGLLVGIWRIFTLKLLNYKIQRQMRHIERPARNPLARLFAVYQQNKHATLQALELKLDDAIIKELPGLERGLNLLKVFAVIAPLLGLLGTVTGMLETFQAITLFGTGDPKLMAGGISHALVTTAMGLMVAVPILLLHTYVLSKSRDIRDILQEQGIGLLVARADRAGVK